MGPLITALRTLTILPFPGKDTPKLSLSLLFFPLVGAFIGGVAPAVWYVQQRVSLSAALCVFVAMGIQTWMTGALHIDGLADTFDAIGGSRGDHDRAQVILKDSRLGSFGVTALIFLVAIKALLWYTFWNCEHIWLILWSIVLARVGQALALAFSPTTRASSIVWLFGKGKTPKVVSAAGLITATSTLIYFEGTRIATVMISTMIITITFGSMYLRKKLGDVSGDCVGAISESIEMLTLFSAAVFVGLAR